MKLDAKIIFTLDAEDYLGSERLVLALAERLGLPAERLRVVSVRSTHDVTNGLHRYNGECGVTPTS